MDEPFKISRVIPARTETFEVLWLVREWMRMSQSYRNIRAKSRNPMGQCWWCRHKFKDGEMMALLGIKGKGNKVFCQGCVDEVVSDEN